MKPRAGLFVSSVTQAGVRVLGSICSLMLMWLIARRSADVLGVFRTLFLYLMIGDFAALLGMQTFVIREISIHPNEGRKLALHALVFGVIVALIGAIGLSCMAFFWTGYSHAIRQGLLIVAMSVPATAASLVAMSILIGMSRATTCSLIQGGEVLIRTCGGIVMVLLGYGILPVIALMVSIRWLMQWINWRTVRPLLQGGTWKLDWHYFGTFLRFVPVFVGITILATVLRFAAPLLIPVMMNDVAAGQFAAAYIFVDMVLLVPTALTINLLPVLARRARDHSGSLRESCRYGVKVMAMGVVPVAAILAAVAHPMFAAIFPGKAAYVASAGVLQVVVWTCCMQSIDQVLAATIVAQGKQHIDLQTLTVGTVGLVFLLIILLPTWGVLGAAWSVMGGSALMLATRFFLVGRHVGGLNPVELLWRPVMAAIPAIVAAFFTSRWQWLAGATSGAIVYLISLALLGAFTETERGGILELLQAGRA
jgi:O-antigen/teichoic acid export membrane protein